MDSKSLPAHLAGLPSDRANSTLNTQRRRLVELMRTLSFGRIENLDVRDGEPFLTDEARIVRVAKLGAGIAPTTENSVEFELKQPVCELFEELRRIKNGKVLVEFRHGLPFLVEITTVLEEGEGHS
jgi:hypothetical protein